MKQINARLAIDGGVPVRKKLLPLYRPHIDQSDVDNVLQTLKSTFIGGNGPDCKKFERNLAEFLGVEHVLLTKSCTASLDLAYMVREFDEGSEVIVPVYTYTSTALAPLLNGLKVIFVDVDPFTGNIDVGKIEERITEKTVAISPVDYAGYPADLDEIRRIALKHNLFIVHDAAQSMGSKYKGRLTGIFGDVSCFSFHATKNLTTGEGGAFVTNSSQLAKLASVKRESGTDRLSHNLNQAGSGFYDYISNGNNYVLSNLLASLGVSQLERLDWLNSERNRIAKIYKDELKTCVDFQFPPYKGDTQTNYHVFFILVPSALQEWIITALEAEMIMVKKHYIPLHLTEFYRENSALVEGGFPGAMGFYQSMIRLPLFPGMAEDDIHDVITAVRKIYQHMPSNSV